MDKSKIYEEISKRKELPEHYLPYNGGNGRVDKCVSLFKGGKLRTGGTIIDIGGSIGDLCYAVRELFDKRVVVDIAELPLKAAAAKGCETILHDMDKGPLPVDDHSVDVVTALDFIEHIIDPGHFARECFRLLKPGGQVFLNTPNIQFWQHLETLVMRGSFPHTSGDNEVYHGGHLAFFTFNDLVEIFGSAGFDGWEQVYDEEGYTAPPESWLKTQQVKTQQDYTRACFRLGCPNLLFKCTKP